MCSEGWLYFWAAWGALGIVGGVVLLLAVILFIPWSPRGNGIVLIAGCLLLIASLICLDHAYTIKENCIAQTTHP